MTEQSLFHIVTISLSIYYGNGERKAKSILDVAPQTQAAEEPDVPTAPIAAE